MEGVFDIYNMEVGAFKQQGIAKLSTFEFSRKNDPISFMRSAMSGMTLHDGKFVRLSVNGVLMMTDTQMEKNSNRTFCRMANGHVFIAGLGIGLILKNILHKLNSGEITKITVIEKYADVIYLVQPYFSHPNIEIINADIFDYQPPKGVKYDTIYFDIWPEICTDNLKEISTLHNKYKFRLNRSNPIAWMNSWMKERLQKEKRY